MSEAYLNKFYEMAIFLRLGTLKPSFDCTCTTPGRPCREPREIIFSSQISQKGSGMLEPKEHSHTVECECALPTTLQTTSGELGESEEPIWTTADSSTFSDNVFDDILLRHMIESHRGTGNIKQNCQNDHF